VYARVTRLEVPLDKLAEEIASTELVQMKVEQTPGSRGLFYMVDHQTGKAMAITLWDTEQALAESQEMADGVTAERQKETSERLVSQETFHVVATPTEFPMMLP
jgi:hypothetical protein